MLLSEVEIRALSYIFCTAAKFAHCVLSPPINIDTVTYWYELTPAKGNQFGKQINHIRRIVVEFKLHYTKKREYSAGYVIQLALHP